MLPSLAMRRLGMVRSLKGGQESRKRTLTLLLGVQHQYPNDDPYIKLPSVVDADGDGGSPKITATGLLPMGGTAIYL